MNLVVIKKNNFFKYNFIIKLFNGDIYSKDYTYEKDEWGDYRKEFSGEEWEKIAFYNLALFKYNCFWIAPVTRYKEYNKFHKFKTFLQKKYGNCMYYTPISNYFFFTYVFIYDNYEFFKNKKNQLIFNVDMSIVEELLYSNMTEKYSGINNYYIHNLYSINRGDIKEYKKKYNLLKKKYKNEKTYYDIGDKYILAENYNKIIGQYKSKKINAIYLSYAHNRGITTKRFIIATFVVIYITLNILKKGGIFTFRDTEYPPKYLSQILHILAKYFDKIYCDRRVIGIGKIGGWYICEGYNGKISTDDDILFKKIIMEWNKIEPGDGYDIKDKYVSSIISYYTEPCIDIHINNRYKEKDDVLQKKVIFFDNVFKDINNVSDDTLIEYNKDINKLHNHRIVGVAHKYNLPVKDSCIVKYGIKNNPIINVLKYNNSIIYGITIKTTINNTTNKTTNKTNNDYINKFNYLVNKINIYKFGLKTTNKKKWKKIIDILSISTLLLNKLPYKNPLLFAEMIEINNIISKYNYKTIYYDIKNIDALDELYSYLPYKKDNKYFDIGVTIKNYNNIEFVNKINIGGSFIFKIKIPNNDMQILSIIYYYSLIFSNIFFIRPNITPLDDLYVYVICIKKIDNNIVYDKNIEVAHNFISQYYNISNNFTELFIEYIKAIYYGIDNKQYISSKYKGVETMYNIIQTTQENFANIWLTINKLI